MGGLRRDGLPSLDAEEPIGAAELPGRPRPTSRPSASRRAVLGGFFDLRARSCCRVRLRVRHRHREDARFLRRWPALSDPSWVSATLLDHLADRVGVPGDQAVLGSCPSSGSARPPTSAIRSARSSRSSIGRWLRSPSRNAITPAAGGGALQVGSDRSLVTPALTVLTPALAKLVVFLGTLFFFLLGRNELCSLRIRCPRIAASAAHPAHPQ